MAVRNAAVKNTYVTDDVCSRYRERLKSLRSDWTLSGREDTKATMMGLY